MVDPALMEPLSCPTFQNNVFHLQAGLIVGGKDTEEGWQTVFCTALDAMSNESNEEYQDLSKPRKVQFECK